MSTRTSISSNDTVINHNGYSRFCTACQAAINGFGQHCGECTCCKSHHLPLADGIYRVNNREYVGIIGLVEVCWGNYREVSRSYFEMQEAELGEVLL